MNELSPQARALLEAGRDAMSPSATTKAKVLGAVEANVASGTAAAGAGLSTAWLAAIATIGLVGAGYWALSRSKDAPQKVASPEVVIEAEAENRDALPQPAVVHPAPPLAPEPNAALEAEAVLETPQDPPGGERNVPAEASAPRNARRNGHKPAAGSRPDAGRRRDAGSRREVERRSSENILESKTALQGLRAERALLARAQAALRQENFELTRDILREHREQFERGVLVPEREAASAIVHCLAPSGTSGKAAARRFLEAYPNSPLASRVRSKCGLDK